ncbi:hypothetical protein, partial [Vibrio sp. 03_296]|uniref:hypothetical protein n=1 Tax=Vibrio sp. 03_296 TaxID=2024409 RepID=UPI002D80662A
MLFVLRDVVKKQQARWFEYTLWLMCVSVLSIVAGVLDPHCAPVERQQLHPVWLCQPSFSQPDP